MKTKHVFTMLWKLRNIPVLANYYSRTGLPFVACNPSQLNVCVPRNCSFQLTQTASSSNVSSDSSKKYQNLQQATREMFLKFYQRYEEYVGLADVQNAQLNVQEAETKFLQARGLERSVMREVNALRNELKRVREELANVSYSSPLYPRLANEQYELVTREEEVQSRLEVAEEKEKDAFLQLSAAMRNSYEKERARVERTKNWSIIGSVVGTILGFLGSSYVNRMRTKELKQIVVDQQDSSELKENVDKILPFVHERYNDVKEEIVKLESTLVTKLVQPSLSEKANGQKISGYNEKMASTLLQLQRDVGQVQAQMSHLKTLLEEKSKKNSSVLPEPSEGLTSEKAAPENFETAAVSDEEENPTSSRKAFIEMAVWGGLMTALYFILSV